jgi:hypothetical protein
MKAQREGINALAAKRQCVLNVGDWQLVDPRRWLDAVISDAVIVHQINMHRNIIRLQVTRSLRASSRGSGGFTIIVQVNFSPARLSPLLIRIR